MKRFSVVSLIVTVVLVALTALGAPTGDLAGHFLGRMLNGLGADANRSILQKEIDSAKMKLALVTPQVKAGDALILQHEAEFAAAKVDLLQKQTNLGRIGDALDAADPASDVVLVHGVAHPRATVKADAEATISAIERLADRIKAMPGTIKQERERVNTLRSRQQKAIFAVNDAERRLTNLVARARTAEVMKKVVSVDVAVPKTLDTNLNRFENYVVEQESIVTPWDNGAEPQIDYSGGEALSTKIALLRAPKSAGALTSAPAPAGSDRDRAE